MNRPSTSIDIQRVAFVENLYSSLRKKTAEAINENNRFNILASSYVRDGLEERECVELLMIDGLTRESAESYTAMALTNEEDPEDSMPEYTFQFEDVSGRRWSGYDIGMTVRAANEDDAWMNAERDLSEEMSVEFQKLLSVTRIDLDGTNF